MGDGTQKRKWFLLIPLLLLIASQAFGFQTFHIESVWAQTSVTIGPDGSIMPSTAPISSLDKLTYTLTGNLTNSYIIVEKDNIVVDGADYAVTGPGVSYSYTGIQLTGRNNVTIRNLKVQAFIQGIRLTASSNCSILECDMLNNRNGLVLAGSCYNNTVSRNKVLSSTDDAVQLVNNYDDNNTFSENTLSGNAGCGFRVGYSSFNVFSGNNMTNSADYNGQIYLWLCNSTLIAGNRIEGGTLGVYLDGSLNCNLSQNSIKNTRTGMRMDSCINLTLRLNAILNATRSFEIWGYGGVLPHYMHNIDASNTIDGKPVYYWTNEKDKTVPKGAGFIGLANCTNIKVTEQDLTNSEIGLLMAFTQNSTIFDNAISSCGYGIHLVGASNNRIIGNEVYTNDYGIMLEAFSTDNEISGNDISANFNDGISFDQSDRNAMFGNTLEANGAGLRFDTSNSNLIYGNNFISSKYRPAYLYKSYNFWDNGYPAGGNYWSSYAGSDANNDEIGDTPYSVDDTDSNQDNFPLMHMATMAEPPPTAFFSYRIDYDTYNVTFDASGSVEYLGEITGYSWDFGDGQTGTGMIVSHVYNFTSAQSLSLTAVAQASAEQDAYDATLTVANNRGGNKSQTRKVGIGNVAILGVRPLQVMVPDVTLIHSEYTVFAIGYASTFKVPVSANVKLDAPGFKPNSSIIRNVLFSPGVQQLAFVKANLVPFDKPAVKVRVIFDPENAIGETNETDNTSNFLESSVNDSKPLKVLYVPVRFNNEDGYPGYYTGYSRALFEQHAYESAKYLRATFPVADSEISYTLSCFNSAVNAGKRPTTKAEADATLKNLVTTLAARGGGSYDRVVGVVKTNWFDGIPDWTGTLGYMYKTSPTACVVTLGNWKVTAHELGHTFGLDENNAANKYGFYAIGMRVLPSTQTWMSTGAIADPPAQETYRVSVPGFWITDSEYAYLVEKMKLPTDPELLFFGATFWKNGTVRPDSWYRIPEAMPDYVEVDTGNYSLVQLNNVGTVLSTVGFNITFENVISEHPDHIVDEVPASFTVPFVSGTKTIQVRDSIGTVVASKTVSTNAPTVSLASLNGGEVLTTDHVQVSWIASDVDGDSLMYNLEVSGDGGVTWDPVAAGLTQTTHDLILTGFKGGNRYLVRVTASDGVNTAKDVSNGYFTIASFSVSATSETKSLQQGAKAYVLLNVTSYGGFSNPVVLNAFCSAADQFSYRWIGNSTISPKVNGYLMAVLEVTFNTTQTGLFSLYLSGSSGSNTEVTAVDFLVDPAEGGADAAPPVTSHNYDGQWHSSDFTITLTTTASNGVNATYYRINGGQTKTVSADGQPLITTEGAANTLEYWSVDNNGTEELPHKMLTQIKLDKTTPTAGIQINNGAAYTNSTTVSLQLSAGDAVSGVSQMRFSNDWGAWTTWEPYATSKSWNLAVGDGEKNVLVQYRDLANLTVTAYQNITLDMTPPVANAGQNQTVLVGMSVAFNGGNSTDNNAVVAYVWDFGDGANGTGIAPSHVYSAAGNYTVRLTVRDAAGNSASSSATAAINVVIPEFSSALAFTAIMALLSALAVAFRRKKVAKATYLNWEL